VIWGGAAGTLAGARGRSLLVRAPHQSRVATMWTLTKPEALIWIATVIVLVAMLV
jgi:hypothetical protein